MRRTVHFVAPETVEVRESPVPDPGPGEVRVRTTVSAISPGTELLVYRGEAPSEMAADPTLDDIGGTLAFPLTYGYAAVGRVTAVGSEVGDDWRDRRVFAFHPHESHFLAAPEALVPLPEDCDPATAALLPNVETAVNFLLDGAPLVGERVAVFGQGLVGLLTTALLATCPLDALCTVEPRAPRRRLSERFGADHSLDPDAVDAPACVREVAGRENAGLPPSPGDAEATADGGEADVASGTDLTYELSGDPAALDDALAATGYDGRVIVGSWYGEKEATLDLGGRYHRSRIDVSASQVSTLAPEHRGRWSTDRRLGVALERLRTGEFDPLVTDRYPVDAAPEAYDRLASDPGDAVGVLLTYE